ncbi:MAG: PSD1 and planctomycete cytochrome C domain-containing protein [Pirellulaceae bacterium]
MHRIAPPPIAVLLIGSAALVGSAALLGGRHASAAEKLDADSSTPTVDFVRDVRPLLSAKCFACHGPDAKEGGLRLDSREAALAEADSGDRAIVPGRPDQSRLLDRVTHDDADLRMPQGKEPLSAEQVAALRNWIAAGAPFQRHWADVPPVQSPLPSVQDRRWPRGALDYYVLSRIEAAGLKPNEEADRYQLARRLYLDLIGLPPTVEEVDAFVADTRPDAYERLVDRLLASPRFGERWSRWWLDLARYADTNGYESDEPRTMWPYRDWVINALNRNMPFDRFTIEQLAGDLLPDPGQERLVATAFHRNTLINTEGGAKNDEFKDAAIKDRVETTATVWLGSTFLCAQCHNHKYDPYTQRDYYALYAIFNNTTDKAVADESDTVPVFYGDWRDIARLRQQLQAAEALIDPDHPAHAEDQKRWEEDLRKGLAAGELLSPTPPVEVIDALDVPAAERTSRQAALVEKWYRRVSPRLKTLRDEHTAIFERMEQYKADRTATVMVMKEGSPQPTHVQQRGNFLTPGELVRAGVPAAYGVKLRGVPTDRLALARWLVEPSHPRTARVTVNRLWDVLWGEGIVATSEDFGSQGDLPSHPLLLDHLAVEFVESGWDVKHLLREIVTSAAYRQSSQITSQKLEADRYNRLLARGPRFRVEAEAVRDVALTASGLLSARIGGPSVFPPQPEAVFENLFIEGGFRKWPESEGDDRYRRGVYTFVKRTALHPMLSSFDGSNRVSCTVDRKRSNTPSAALNTLNGPTFVEASGALGIALATHAGDTAARIEYGFRRCATRLPQPREVEALTQLYNTALVRFENDPAAVYEALKEGRVEAPEGVAPPQLAAWLAVANTLLNMDATLTKG